MSGDDDMHEYRYNEQGPVVGKKRTVSVARDGEAFEHWIESLDDPRVSRHCPDSDDSFTGVLWATERLP
jgi:hypothetical protein